jgi:hypothetical protein
MILRGEDSQKVNEVKKSIEVTNSTPSVSGKDMPSVAEIKNIIKYYNGAQERCVTLKDYHSRILQMPPRYGCPFRVSVTEENNKIMIYALGLNENGALTDVLPSILVENMINYLSEYRMINDFIEIKSGRIINLQVEIDVYIDKNYNASNVLTDITKVVTDYLDINNREMGEDIFVGDIEKEISKVDGVQNLIEFRVYNIYGDGYSETRTTQETMEDDGCGSSEEVEELENRSRINLSKVDKTLVCDTDSMLEIKYPEKDIICQFKIR